MSCWHLQRAAQPARLYLADAWNFLPQSYRPILACASSANNRYWSQPKSYIANVIKRAISIGYLRLSVSAGFSAKNAEKQHQDGQKPAGQMHLFRLEHCWGIPMAGTPGQETATTDICDFSSEAYPGDPARPYRRPCPLTDR